MDCLNDGESPVVAGIGDQSVPWTVPDRTDGEELSVPDGADSPENRGSDDAWLDELLPIARAASERAGRISRDAVKDAVRAHQPTGNERLGILLARLKQDEEDAPKGLARDSASLR